jgi:hypothetical protein
MELFKLLENNKGTVSSALGKELANKVIGGELTILNEAIELCTYIHEDKKAKRIRAGAAKIVEQVSRKKPELVAPSLEKLLPALNAEEPQTRWMIIYALGFCAKLNPEVAVEGISYAERFIKERNGVCLSGAAELYLGQIGALNVDYAQKAFRILIDAIDSPMKNELDWILEGLTGIIHNLTKKECEVIQNYVNPYNLTEKKSTQKRVDKLLKLCKLQIQD